ncbi:MAG: AlpA family phage regulatory protein [Aquipseudomonas alcaligenes]|uniref:AlpA family phage regulatory protein n=1 Tax=Aquipseudomonas alcaligenes TaxID=43263 RepID=A0A5C7WCV6_AQUAC|nr:MAG: AlpA family phage regulatory protein [Pseudomonas alcaligenes]
MHPVKRTIRRPEVLAKTGLSATTIYNLEKRREFPQHFMLTPRCAVWLEEDIDAWLDARMAAPAEPAPAPDVALRKTTRGRVSGEVRA